MAGLLPLAELVRLLHPSLRLVDRVPQCVRRDLPLDRRREIDSSALAEGDQADGDVGHLFFDLRYARRDRRLRTVVLAPEEELEELGRLDRQRHREVAWA